MCQFVFFIYLVFIHKWPFSAISAVVCAPTHADRRRQDILATHGYENTDWFFNMVLCVFMVNVCQSAVSRLFVRDGKNWKKRIWVGCVKTHNIIDIHKHPHFILNKIFTFFSFLSKLIFTGLFVCVIIFPNYISFIITFRIHISWQFDSMVNQSYL